MLRTTIIRAFDGSLADAEGLLAVEKATFDESPYSVVEVQAMLTHETQRAWLAVSQDEVVGFVTAFSTASLRGPWWEIDLLAVHPDWTGRGLATRLIRAAAAYRLPPASPIRAPASPSWAKLRRARAVVATNNPGSARAFTRAGFRRAGRCRLWIFRPKEQSPHPWVALDLTAREVQGEELAGLAVLASEAKQPPSGGDNPTALPGHESGQGSTLLLAESRGQPLGYAELVEVQTLLYRGVWIESLVASKQIAYAALVHEAMKRAATADLDELGMMVPEHDQGAQEAFQAAGFRSLGSFDWFTAALPLPGPASDAEQLQGIP
jgi:ribosomal protein S18 acetylase RimI-like enzyme